MHPVIDQLFTDHVDLAVRPYAHMSRVAGPGTSIRGGAGVPPTIWSCTGVGQRWVPACLPACLHHCRGVGRQTRTFSINPNLG